MHDFIIVGGGSAGSVLAHRLSASGAVVAVASFTATVGTGPVGAPVAAGGVFYGVTSGGGASGRGTAYTFSNTAGLSLVGVRCPAHPVARALLAAVGAPLVAPSANRFGRVSPTTALAVVAELGADLLVLDGGPCAVGVESTVVAFEDDGAPVVLRPGGLSLDAVRAHTGREPRVGGRGRVEAPGQTASHYAPARPATLLPAALPECGLPPGRWAVLASTTPEARVRALAGPGTTLAAVEVLSAAGDSVVAAQRLFAALRRLDEADADVLLEPWSPNGGLADALRDRLRRAAAAR